MEEINNNSALAQKNKNLKIALIAVAILLFGGLIYLGASNTEIFSASINGPYGGDLPGGFDDGMPPGGFNNGPGSYPGGIGGNLPGGTGNPLPLPGGQNPLPVTRPGVPTKQQLNEIKIVQEELEQATNPTPITSSRAVNFHLELEESQGNSCFNLFGSQQQLWKTLYVKAYEGSTIVNFTYHPNNVELFSSLNGGAYQQVRDSDLDGPCGPNPCNQSIGGKNVFTIEHLLNQAGEIKLKVRAYECEALVKNYFFPQAYADWCDEWTDSNEITFKVYPQENALYKDLQVSGNAQISTVGQTKEYKLKAVDIRGDAVTAMNFDLNYLNITANKGTISSIVKSGSEVKFNYTPNQIGNGTLTVKYECKNTTYTVTVPQPAPAQEDPPAQEELVPEVVTTEEPEEEEIIVEQVISAMCGNNIVEEGEVCDEGNSNNNDYQSTRHCKTDCSGYATYCGDGLKNGPEVCDGSVPAGRTCATEIGAQAMGVLSCSAECAIDTSSCKTHSIVNCPSSILPQNPPTARPNLILKGAGISALSWNFDGAEAEGSGNSLVLQGLSLNNSNNVDDNHTAILNETDECIFKVGPYTYDDYLEAKRIANLSNYSPTLAELILYDYNVDGVITTEDKVTIYNSL